MSLATSFFNSSTSDMIFFRMEKNKIKKKEQKGAKTGYFGVFLLHVVRIEPVEAFHFLLKTTLYWVFIKNNTLLGFYGLSGNTLEKKSLSVVAL